MLLPVVPTASPVIPTGGRLRRPQWRDPSCLPAGKRLAFRMTMICCLLFLTPTPASAQSFDLSISPPITHILIKPNTSIIQAFNLKNYSDHPLTLIARLVPFSPGNRNGIPELNLDSSPKYLDYFTLANSKIRLNQPFTLAANGSDQLVLQVKFPQNSSLADYYTSLVVSQVSPDLDQLTGTQLSGAVVSNILLTVNLVADPNVNLSLAELRLDSSLFKIGPYQVVDTLSPVTFSAVAKNHSPFLVTTSGNFSLRLRNSTRLTSGYKPVYLLAYSERSLESSESAGFTYHPHPFDLGLASANFSLVQNSASVSETITFIIFPVKILFSLILVATLLTFIIAPLVSKKLNSSLDSIDN